MCLKIEKRKTHEKEEWPRENKYIDIYIEREREFFDHDLWCNHLERPLEHLQRLHAEALAVSQLAGN